MSDFFITLKGSHEEIKSKHGVDLDQPAKGQVLTCCKGLKWTIISDGNKIREDEYTFKIIKNE